MAQGAAPLPAQRGGSLGASRRQVGTATSPAGPCPSACPSMGPARGLKPRLSRGIPKAVSFALNVCSMSLCACKGSTPRSAQPLLTWAREGTPTRLPAQGERGDATARSRRSRFHSPRATATTQQPPSPFPHLAGSGQLELQVLDGGVLGTEHVLQRETARQAAAAQPRRRGGRTSCCAVAELAPGPGSSGAARCTAWQAATTLPASGQPQAEDRDQQHKRQHSAAVTVCPAARVGGDGSGTGGITGITGSEALGEDAGGS